MKKIFLYSIIILITLSLLKVYVLNGDEPVSFYNFIIELSNIKFEFVGTVTAFEGLSANFDYIMNSFTDCTSVDLGSLIFNFISLTSGPLIVIAGGILDLLILLKSVFTFLFRILSIGY